jgi:hypothetical protein
MKNSLFRKILAVGATLALVSSFFVAVPVSAAPGANAWDDINMPKFVPNTELGVMDVAPDGTIFLAVWTHPVPEDFGSEGGTPTNSDTDDGYWLVKYSEDGGFTWKNTNMPAVYDNDPWTKGRVDKVSAGATPMAIKVSPMWPSNKNVYVAFSDGTIWRLPNAGLGTPAQMKGIVDAQSQILGAEVDGKQQTFLWDMDIWADGTYNYLAVATDLDIFVIKDQLLAEWVDYELNVSPFVSFDGDADNPASYRIARAVRFAPDFATSELIWAVVADELHEPTKNPHWQHGTLRLTSADSPTRWGFVFEEIAFVPYDVDRDFEGDTRFVDIAFDPDYTSALPQLYVAIANDYPFDGLGNLADDFDKVGNLYAVSGEAKTSGPGDMDSGYIFFEDQALGSVQVSGSTIMVQNVWTGDVYTTNDRGNTWPEAKRSPAGKYGGHLLMSPNYATDKTVYSTSFDANWTYIVPDFLARGGISGFYLSTDGGVFFDGISLLDMPTTYGIRDLAFDPKGGSQPVLMVLNTAANLSGTDYIFYTADATAKSVRWLMKDSMENYGDNVPTLGSPIAAIEMLSWDTTGSVVMFMGLKEGQHYVFRSYDEGNSFAYWRKMPVVTTGAPADWVVVDNNTISVAGANGYWGTRAIGTETKIGNDVFTAGSGVSIARYGDKIAVGLNNGTIRVSADAGKTWSAPVTVGTDGVYVAYGPDGALYAASDSVYKVTPGTTAGAYNSSELVDSLNNDADNTDGYNGIWVSPDNTLYAKDEDGMVRLLIGEAGNRWQFRAQDGAGLWGTLGSNLVWTHTGSVIAALEDFNSGAVQGVTVEEIDKNPSSGVKTIKVTWKALPATNRYAIYVDDFAGSPIFWNRADTADWTATTAPDGGVTLSKVITGLDYNTKYDVQVRAAAWGALQSRLSTKVSITTDCQILAPSPLVPAQGMQDASLAPSFVWEAIDEGCAPVKYDFQLSTDPNFGSYIIDTTVTGTGYTYTARDLAYDTNHYWRVRSVAADGTKSAWTTIQNFHTMLKPVEPTQAPDITLTVTQNPAPVVTVSIPPQQTVTVPPAVTLTQTVTSVPTPTLVMPEQPTPAYIWVIVAVGAVLTIAVIVLIIRTRRAE